HSLRLRPAGDGPAATSHLRPAPGAAPGNRHRDRPHGPEAGSDRRRRSRRVAGRRRGRPAPIGAAVWSDGATPSGSRALTEPQARRPYMPGYGLLGPDQGTGVMPWSWAVERLTASRNYWVVSRWPDGRPHAMPVWGIWHEESFWFSSSKGSGKARNLMADPRCGVATEE